MRAPGDPLPGDRQVAPVQPGRPDQADGRNQAERHGGDGAGVGQAHSAHQSGEAVQHALAPKAAEPAAWPLARGRLRAGERPGEQEHADQGDPGADS